MRNILLVAYHFPPSSISSGHLRTLALVRYLPDFGWRPCVLSANPRAYTRVDSRLLAEVPDHVTVTRAFALDAKKHLGINGTYPILLAQPDRWASWWFGAVPAGLRLIRRHRPAVIWSTYPIASAHLIAHTLHRLTGIPWVADFRDPIGDSDTAGSPLTRKVRGWVERRTVEHSACNVFTTAGAARLYAERYPERRSEDFEVIPNGFDEVDFADLPNGQPVAKKQPAALQLIHSGLLYREQRDPSAFLAALAELRSGRDVSPDSLQVTLRASGHEQHYAQVIDSLGLGDMVMLRPPVPYHEALREQYEADGLLLFQGSEYNRQVPAKVYEYLRIGRPIFALTDPSGDTAAMLRAAGVGSVVQMDSKEAIVPALRQFISTVRERECKALSPEEVAKYSRRSRVEELATLLDRVAVTSGK